MTSALIFENLSKLITFSEFKSFCHETNSTKYLKQSKLTTNPVNKELKYLIELFESEQCCSFIPYRFQHIVKLVPKSQISIRNDVICYWDDQKNYMSTNLLSLDQQIKHWHNILGPEQSKNQYLWDMTRQLIRLLPGNHLQCRHCQYCPPVSEMQNNTMCLHCHKQQISRLSRYSI